MDGDLSSFKTRTQDFTAQSERSLRRRGSCSRFHRASSMPLYRPSTVAPHRKGDRTTKNAPKTSTGSVEVTDHKIADFQKLNRLLMTGRTLSDSLERLVEETNTHHMATSSDSHPNLPHRHQSKQSSTKTREDGMWFRRARPSDRAGSRLINLREISSSAPLIEIVEVVSNDARAPRIGACPLTPDIRVHIASDSEDYQDDISRHDMEPERRFPMSLDGLIDSLHCIVDERERLTDEDRPLMDEDASSSDQPPPPPPPSTAPNACVSPPPTNYLRDQIASLFQVSDNKLALKLFGNKNALLREKLRQKAVGNCVIHPCSTFRLVLILTRLPSMHPSVRPPIPPSILPSTLNVIATRIFRV